MQTPGAHRLDLRGVGLHREELHLLAGQLGHVIKKALPDLSLGGRIFDGGIGEDQRVGIDQLGVVCRDVGDEVAVIVDVAIGQRELRGSLRISELPDSDYAKSRTTVSVIPGQFGHG